MIQIRSAAVLAVLVLTCALAAPAQEQGYWRAAGQSARDTTGDVAFSPERLTLDFSAFPIARIRTLSPSEVTAAFALDQPATSTGNLYRLDVPGSKRFLHKNTLCGAEDAEWMTVYVSGRSLQLAFFSGQTPPVFTPEAMANATDLCGTFSYVR